MKSPRLLVALGALLAILGLFTWLLWGKLEWSERETWVGYSGEARVNDFLAAQRLLERMGQPARSIRGIPEGNRLLGRNDVILLPRRQVRLTPGQAHTLLQWVEQGGLLITTGWIPEIGEAKETRDPLFEAVGARLVRREEYRKAYGEEEAKPDFDPKAFIESNRTVDVTLDNRTYRTQLGVWTEILDLDGKATLTAGNASGVKLAVYDHGQGRLVLATDLSCLDNGTLADDQHAGFLSALALDWADHNKVWIIYREEPPSLTAWLKQHAWMPLSALGVLILASLWSASARFGPRIPDPSEGRRSMLEHLMACGRFQWTKRDGLSLLQATRQATQARIHHTHPGWSHMEPADLHARLAETCAISRERIARALHSDLFKDPRDFTEAIQTLDLIRKKL